MLIAEGADVDDGLISRDLGLYDAFQVNIGFDTCHSPLSKGTMSTAQFHNYFAKTDLEPKVYQ